MNIPGTDRPPGESEPSATPDPTTRVEGDHIAADIGDAAANAQIAEGKDISQTTVHIHQPQPYRPPLQRPARADHFQDRTDELARLLSDYN
jgi:hypothetical protein